MSKQTAVEWLERQINLGLSERGLISAIKEAKKMEKEQTISAVKYGCSDWGSAKDAEHYFNETYGGNNSEITMNNQSSTFPYVCASCNKEMVAGGFPKWFCLHTTCKNYLKPITK
jgi:hypothetical protein